MNHSSEPAINNARINALKRFLGDFFSASNPEYADALTYTLKQLRAIGALIVSSDLTPTQRYEQITKELLRLAADAPKVRRFALPESGIYAYGRNNLDIIVFAGYRKDDYRWKILFVDSGACQAVHEIAAIPETACEDHLPFLRRKLGLRNELLFRGHIEPFDSRHNEAT